MPQENSDNPPASHVQIEKTRNGRRLLRGRIDQLKWALIKKELDRIFEQSKSTDDFLNRLQEHGYELVDSASPRRLQDMTEELRRNWREENQRNQAKSTEIEETGAQPQSEELSPGPHESK